MTLCPHCDGEHLEGLRFQHRSVCDLYPRETQTQAADHERITANRGRPITRDATPAEIILLETLGEVDPADPGQVAITATFSGGLWDRTTTITQNTITTEGAPE